MNTRAWEQILACPVMDASARYRHGSLVATFDIGQGNLIRYGSGMSFANGIVLSTDIISFP